jgi:hypothetical protein
MSRKRSVHHRTLVLCRGGTVLMRVCSDCDRMHSGPCMDPFPASSQMRVPASSHRQSGWSPFGEALLVSSYDSLKVVCAGNHVQGGGASRAQCCESAEF